MMKLSLVVCLACVSVAAAIGFFEPSKTEPTTDWQPPSIDMTLLDPTPILLEPAGLTHKDIERLQMLTAEMDYVINELKKGLEK